MATEKKAKEAPKAASSTKAAHKIGQVGALVLAAISKTAALTASNGFTGVEGLTPMTVKPGETVQKGVKNSASAVKNEKNKIANKLTFDEKTGMPKASISKLMAGDESHPEFKAFRALAKSAWADLATNKYTPAVKALAAKAVSFGGTGGGGVRQGKALPIGGGDML